jgi:DNA-binding NtrC family response regulator
MVVPMMRILWIGSAHGAARQVLARVDRPEVVAGVPEALAWLGSRRAGVGVASFPMAAWSPVEALDALRRAAVDIPVIVLDPGATVSGAARLARRGAWQVFDAGASPETVLEELRTAAEQGRPPAASGAEEPWRRWLVGNSRAMEDVARIVRLVGPRRATVLVSGETGTGKEMAARALHMAGARAHLPMVAVSCAALPESLLEAELFGHTRGAFTGAVASRAGRFEQAHGSTLFLDEVGELPLELQAKLLRVLQEREFQRLGSSETVRVDVRVIAATNADLAALVRQGRFREDLYYRLNVVPLHMPPLRARAADIPLLACHFVDKICRAERMPPKRIAREALDRLSRYSWPGNVRQLENAVETAAALSGGRASLEPSDFPLAADGPARVAEPCFRAAPAVPDEGLDFEREVSHFERSLLEQALRKAGGNKTVAADMLRLKRTTLSAKLRSLETAWPGAEPGIDAEPAMNMVQ